MISDFKFQISDWGNANDANFVSRRFRRLTQMISSSRLLPLAPRICPIDEDEYMPSFPIASGQVSWAWGGFPLFVGRCPTLSAARPLALDLPVHFPHLLLSPFPFPFFLSPFSFLLSPFSFSLSPFSFPLFPFSFFLFPFSFSLFPFSFLLFPFSFLLLPLTLCPLPLPYSNPYSLIFR